MNRQTHFIPLESVQIASPCRADWNKMQGDERTRFCQSCAKNVYNLSEMSRAQAEALISEKEGNLCVRFYQRVDGTILTDNCPIGLRAVRRPFQWLSAGFVALMASGVAIVNASSAQPQKGNLNCPPPRWGLLQPIQNWWMGRAQSETVTTGKMATPTPKIRQVMGDMAEPAPTVSPTPTPTATPDPKI